MSADVLSHKAAFDAEYRKFGPADQGLRLEFPLRDIEKFPWKRGEWNNDYFNWYYRRFSVHILHRLSVPRGGSVLTVGCGLGYDECNIKHLQPDARLWSIDISEEMVLRARDTGCPAELAVATAEQLPFPDNSFDRVVSREVIEHVMEPQVMLDEIRRVLKPGGRAVITTENCRSISPHNYYWSTVAPFIARMTGYTIKGKSYKDEAPTDVAVKAMAEKAGLVLSEVMWDGAVYKYQPELSPVLRERMREVAIAFSCLENGRLLSRLFCDQVKYVIDKSAATTASSENAPGFVCPSCRAPLQQEAAGWRCVSCAKTFPVRNGVPDFILYTGEPKPAAPAVAPVQNSERSARWFDRLHRRAQPAYEAFYYWAAKRACRFVPPNSKVQPSRYIPVDEPLNDYLRVDP